MQTATTSKQFSLNLSDWWKGLILAVVVPVFKVILDTINTGELTFNWGAIGRLALAAIIGYLLKNFLTPSKIVVSGATEAVMESVKEGETLVKVGSTVAEVTTPTAKP